MQSAEACTCSEHHKASRGFCLNISWSRIGLRCPRAASCSKPLALQHYLVQVIGAGIHPLPEDVPFLPTEQAPERWQAVNLQAVEPEQREDAVHQSCEFPSFNTKQLPSLHPCTHSLTDAAELRLAKEINPRMTQIKYSVNCICAGPWHGQSRLLHTGLEYWRAMAMACPGTVARLSTGWPLWEAAIASPMPPLSL